MLTKETNTKELRLAVTIFESESINFSWIEDTMDEKFRVTLAIHNVRVQIYVIRNF